MAEKEEKESEKIAGKKLTRAERRRAARQRRKGK